MNTQLFDKVKQKLNITWEDEDTNSRIQNIIGSAIPTLTHKLGITDEYFDFADVGAEHNLFLAYCLYEWNHATNEFDDNYSNEIAQIRRKWEVKHFLENEGLTE